VVISLNYIKGILQDYVTHQKKYEQLSIYNPNTHHSR